MPCADNRVVFVTGGAGSICSIQTKALVYLGANACIIGRNPEKTERAAKEIAAVRPGSKVIGIGAVDVRSVSTFFMKGATRLDVNHHFHSLTASRVLWTDVSGSWAR